MNGLVTFTGLSSGTTTINGACIKTGLIDADRLNLTGAITFGDLSSSVQGDINEALNTANDAYDLAYDNQLPVYIKSTYIDSTQIMSPTITGGTITGGYIYGGRYYNLSGGAYLEVGGSEFGNLIIWGSGNNPVFTVEDGVGGISLSTYRHTFLSVSSINGWATPSGTWNFSNANVTGLKTTAVFG